MTISAADLADDLIDVVGQNAEAAKIKGYLDTGIPELNKMISGDYAKGLPQGRVVEVFGPSSSGKTFLATMAMRAVQELGGIAFFSDHERSFDPDFAETLGMSVDPTIFKHLKPETFEDSVDMMWRSAKMIRDKGFPMEIPCIWVFDSVAAMIPKSKLYDEKGNLREVGSYKMNDALALAKACSQSYPTLKMFAEDCNFHVLLLNQIRQKPGVMYGDPTCLHGSTKVPFVDGTSASMKEIVEKQIKKEVWSFNELSGELEPAPITGWHNNGDIENTGDWVHIEAKGLHCKNGRIGFTCTPDHLLLMSDSTWKDAGKVRVGDKLVTRRKTSLNGTFEDFLRAAMSGDAPSFAKQGRNVASIRLQDNNDPEYMRWKRDKLSKFMKFTKGVNTLKGKNYEFWQGSESTDVKLIHDELRNNRCPLQMLQKISPISLAVWIMDDAHWDGRRYQLSVKRFARSEDLSRISDQLFDAGFDFGVRRGEGRIDFTHESSMKIAEMIAPYVPECMSHKLPERFRGQYADFELEAIEYNVPEFVEIVEVRPLGEKARLYNRNRYDITVEKNHNYMVGSKDNGIIVHNCTPGGNAAEFYADLRLSLGKSNISEGTGKDKQIAGFEIKAKAVKSKIARPHQTATWQIRFNEEGGGVTIDQIATNVDYLIRLGKILQTGNRVEWEGKKLYPKQLIELLKKDPEGNNKLMALLIEENS